MSKFSISISDDMMAKFDAWASQRGGRSAALRQLMRQALPMDTPLSIEAPPSGNVKVHINVTIEVPPERARSLNAIADKAGLSKAGWVSALIARHLQNQPTFHRSDEVALLAIWAELRRIRTNVNEMVRSLHADRESGGDVLDVNCLQQFSVEIRTHMMALRDAFAGNLAYWKIEL